MGFDYKSIYFPYEQVRKYQDRLIHGVKCAIEASRVLIAHAPTGLGKTAAVLAPALKHALSSSSTIFFLTPRHTQHQLVINTLRLIKERFRLEFNALDLVGKQWMCPMPPARELSSSEFVQYCKDLREKGKCNYYNNSIKDKSLTINAKKIFNELLRKGPLHVNEFMNECVTEELCPQELAYEACRKSTVIVCDYFHLFHERIRDSFLSKMKKELSKSIIIVDEAHNLPDRIRSLMSARLTTYSLKRSIKELRDFNLLSEEEAVKSINNILMLGDGERELKIDKEVFKKKVVQATGYGYDELIARLMYASEVIREERDKSSTHAVASFLDYWQEGGSDYVRIMKQEESRGGSEFVSLTSYCLDPSRYSEQVFSACESAILMSGTLTPSRMYSELLGINEPMILELKSPFPKNNRLTIIDPEFTTRYSKRSEKNYKLIAERLSKVVKDHQSNTAVFFPSYKVMMNVLSYFNRLCEKKLIVEQQGIGKEAKESMLDSFIKSSKQGAVLFGVIGGNFSEGINLPGERLECVIIVGVPLQPPDLYAKSLINYYDEKFNKGYDYGYIYPAITRVIQSAGRCIRSGSDRGVILLMDERYLWSNYSKCIPTDWDLVITKEPHKLINDFLKRP